jgi:ferredoxin
MKTRIGAELSIEALGETFDAVLVAVGRLKDGDAEWLGLETGASGVVIKGKTYGTSLPGVFAGGDAVRRRKLTVRAVADGKEAAVAIGQYLSGCAVTGVIGPFNTHIGRLKDGEIEKFVACASEAPRLQPSSRDAGFTDQQARGEAARCLHCDCRKAQNCKLRQYGADYDARPRRYKSDRRLFEQHLQHPDIIFEPGKCIDCGLCIQITAKAGEALGLAFIGRGFDVRVAVPFDHSIAEGLKGAAAQCVAACPTGALAFKKET